MSEQAGFLLNPSWIEMADYCGLCHEDIASAFQRGRFGRAIEAGEWAPSCRTCHMQRGHDIGVSHPGLLLTAEQCPECLQVESIDDLQHELGELRALKTELLARTAALEAAGVPLRPERGQARSAWAEHAAELHTFDRSHMELVRAEVAATLGALLGGVSIRAASLEQRTRYGNVVLLALAGVFVALVLMKRKLRRNAGGPSHEQPTTPTSGA
jgi:hypothetical protein